jgi:hypothetical protein
VQEEPLTGGGVGGAVRVGATVRRSTGPWTPAVHALLAFLEGRLPHVPRVHGFDEQGREILDYLPGHIIDLDAERLTEAQLVALVRWTGEFHRAVADFTHPGPWRYFAIEQPTLIGHNDIAPYNACFDGDELVGVFDWDMAGPTNPLAELAFLAWNCVPLWVDIGAELAARRLTVIARTYGGFTAAEILLAVPPRIQIMLDGIPAHAAAGDRGMANLMTQGEPERSRRSRDAMVGRIPAILRVLGS